MKRLVLVGMLAACSRELSEGYPINPGGGGSSTTHMPDAPAASDDGGTMINGRVCLLLANANPQSLATCAGTGAGNFTVTLGSATATTADDGSFTMMRPAVTMNLVWFVTGTGIEKSAIKYGPTTLPALDTIIYQEMLQSTDATIGAGTGALMMRVTHPGGAVSGATVATMPTSDSGIFYDGPSEIEWQTVATGTYGVAWAPSITTGNANLTITSGATDTTVMAQPVFADTITFVFAEIP